MSKHTTPRSSHAANESSANPKTWHPDDMLDHEPLIVDDGPLLDYDELYEFETIDDSLEPGCYVAVVTNLETTESSAGNKQFDITCRLCEHDRTQHIWLSHLPAARWRLVAVLKAFGIEPDTDGRLLFRRSDIVGKYAKLRLVNRTWQGRTTLQVDAVDPVTDAERARYSTTPEV